MRIPIPTNADDFIKLAQALALKHAALGAASPLKNIEGIDNIGTLAATADTQNKLAIDLRQQAETAIETRDRAIGPNSTTLGCLQFLVTSSRDVLAGQNKGAEHKLGEWGFGIIASVAKTPEQKAAAKAAKAAKAAAKP